ncbi:hypothetical protein BU038_03830 [Staphylococcus simulans]|nr:hypothetical protein BU038_03830 [Staphylococcus simulans]
MHYCVLCDKRFSKSNHRRN